jgi:peptidoglycan/LPS O-acetylase OafA/YrhL
MALSIMLYHLAGRDDVATALGKLGVYGVSIFFVLSGLSMAIAYDRYIKDLRSSGYFFIRRLFRIWPLLWIAAALVALPAQLAGEPFSTRVIVLNLSTLFGFVAPTEYINMGAWSIGNEMVYYTLTPIFIAAYHGRKALGNLATLLTVAIGMVFSFHLMSSSATLASQWALYINPFDNLFLYCAGLAIYYNLRDLEINRRWHLPLLFLTVALFFLYPASGDQISIVTGVNRVGMSLLSVAMVIVFYKCPVNLPEWLGDKFEQLGMATYGVYLLHPIIIDWVRRAAHSLNFYNPYLFAFVALVLTIALALALFHLVESPLIRLGKRLTRNPSAARRLPPDQLAGPVR